MTTKDKDVVRYLERCFAQKLCFGAPFIERFLTDEEKAFGERLKATYAREREWRKRNRTA